MTVTHQPVTFPSGPATLVGELTLPSAPPTRAILINSAAGVSQGFYRKFVTWLAETLGAVCLTYDYRDFGASRAGPLRHSTTTMADWGIYDGQAARDWLTRRYPDLSLWVIGHSLGGMMIPFQNRLDKIERLIAVASGPVHVSNHPWPYQVLARSFWYGHGPMLASMFGYLPGRLSGLGADLPKGVYTQWRRWCTTPTFVEKDIGRALPPLNPTPLTADFKLLTLADDVMIPATQAPRMLDLYSHAARRHVNITPADHGLSKIGHFGAFSRRNKVIWPQIIA